MLQVQYTGETKFFFFAFWKGLIYLPFPFPCLLLEVIFSLINLFDTKEMYKIFDSVAAVSHFHTVKLLIFLKMLGRILYFFFDHIFIGIL